MWILQSRPFAADLHALCSRDLLILAVNRLRTGGIGKIERKAMRSRCVAAFFPHYKWIGAAAPTSIPPCCRAVGDMTEVTSTSPSAFRACQA